MSNITYTPETKAELQAWMDSCPRELANVICVCIAQVKSQNGDVNHIGLTSIVNTRRSDALAIIEEHISTLVDWHNNLSQPKM